MRMKRLRIDGECLRPALERIGMERSASELGITPQELERYLEDEIMPHEIVRRIKDALGIEPEDYVFDLAEYVRNDTTIRDPLWLFTTAMSGYADSFERKLQHGMTMHE